MPEPMSEDAEFQIRYIASLDDAPGPFSRKVITALRAALAEMDRLRALLGPPETVWGHQVHADDGHIGDTVPQGGEFAARKAVEYMNTQILGPDAGARAKLVVHEVWHAETEWRVVEDA